MVLTEPGQGSSLGDIKTRARPAEDGSYRIIGQKIFISGGDHDLTDNICFFHMVLAKIDGSPPGAKGISAVYLSEVSGQRRWLARRAQRCCPGWFTAQDGLPKHYFNSTELW